MSCGDVDPDSPAEIDFIAIGGVWLDEIRIGKKVISRDEVGGSVTFATLGARLFRGCQPERVRLVMKAGHDFPPTASDIFRDWRVDLVTQICADHPSAKGIVQYDHDTTNRISYTRCTSPLLTTPHDLSPLDVQTATAFHFFDTPASIVKQVREIRDLLAEPPTRTLPLLVWEPQAKSCSPETLSEHQHASAEVHVFSPNHIELYALWGVPVLPGLDREFIESHAAQFSFTGQNCVVIRCGEYGCYVTDSSDTRGVWLPAFYPDPSDKVVDPTGAGNAFLGGFAMGYLDHGSFVEAAEYGTVAASFAVEQVGLPLVRGRGDGETWNGVDVRQRLGQFRARLRGGQWVDGISA